MSQSEVSSSSRVLTFIGGIGAILIFAVVLFVAYLPSRPAAADAAANAARQATADESRAEGQGKLTGYEVLSADAGTVRIPISDAMGLTVDRYRAAAK